MKRIISGAVTIIVVALMLAACGKYFDEKRDNPTTGAIIVPEYTNEITGRIARFDGGTVMIISEEAGAVVLSGDMNFDGLGNGDYVTVLCDDIEETYPARTVVKEMYFKSKGSIEDLPSEELEKLEGFGWKLETE